MNTAALKLEVTIAAACNAAHNKYAETFVNAAHGNLIETAIKNQPPAWFMPAPAPASFEDAAEYLKKLALAFDEIARHVASEANQHSPTHIGLHESIFTDALHDSGLLDELNEAAERVREDAMEVA